MYYMSNQINNFNIILQWIQKGGHSQVKIVFGSRYENLTIFWGFFGAMTPDLTHDSIAITNCKLTERNINVCPPSTRKSQYCEEAP